ncbi:hypothetical protein ACT80S_14920 [Ramlibacter sp. MAHUQ-53]|uniref:hypothetical protein n=1 Tax=unclassified Ramlibacter TaxID=2617605 RepID=UPI003636E170
MPEISNSNVHTASLPTFASAPRHGEPLKGLVLARVGIEVSSEQYAAAAGRIRTALAEGWDPTSQLEEAKPDPERLAAMSSAAGKIESESRGPSLYEFQLLFIQVMHEIRNLEREVGAKERSIAEEKAEESFKTSLLAAQKERDASTVKGAGMIVQGVIQAKVAASTPNVATAQGVGSALGGITELAAAGSQQDASVGRAKALLIDKEREGRLGNAQRAQENASNAKQAADELTRSLREMWAANAEQAKVIARG